MESRSAESLSKFGKVQGCSKLEDRISHLPDEILVSILSHFNIEEQARTSILAHRWTYLWRYATSLMFVLKYAQRSAWREFVNHISHILESHLATTIDDLTVAVRLEDKIYQHDIDGWLKFALENRVKTLDFNFYSSQNESNNYSLTAAVVCPHTVDSLTTLNLKGVDVTGDFLEYLLSVSPSLEALSVSITNALVDFTVSGPSLKLRYLEVKSCRRLERLHICDVNLVSFKYSGNPGCIVTKDTPRLTEVHLPTNDYLVDAALILSQIPSVEMLILGMNFGQGIKSFPKFPEWQNLKHLELTMCPNIFCCQLCAHLLEASPVLSELKLVFRCFVEGSSEEREVERLEHPHKCLKVVELIGFIGCRVDLGIGLYVIDNAANLEKMIVDTRYYYRHFDRVTNTPNNLAAATLATQQLGTRLPLTAQMIII